MNKRVRVAIDKTSRELMQVHGLSLVKKHFISLIRLSKVSKLYTFFILLYVPIFSWHTKSPNGSFFYSAIGGLFLPDLCIF